MWEFVDLGRLLLREVGFVVYSCCWALPAQSFSGLSPTELMTIFYRLNFLDFPNLEVQVPVFCPLRNRVA
jgi:hypothetical protein